ncbi:hypothetical protein JTE90_018749 [Oedothorax gibbosus]|uniref:Uncharacterized protein n=1 Tax=Oedothorax gibbosus TaxID=931172 RepID=A0AAV6UBX8_9ARAC|nr:hypothetical protein JTE90_018749 [Oedothorax gibbosus]
MGIKVEKLAFVLSFLIDFGIFASAAPENEIKMPALAAPLAVGGMMQGLLNMQVRPEGGFYEEKYKEIFKDSSDLFTPAKYDSLLNVDIDELLKNKEPKLTVLEDGKSLSLGRV